MYMRRQKTLKFGHVSLLQARDSGSGDRGGEQGGEIQSRGHSGRGLSRGLVRDLRFLRGRVRERLPGLDPHLRLHRPRWDDDVRRLFQRARRPRALRFALPREHPPGEGGATALCRHHCFHSPEILRPELSGETRGNRGPRWAGSRGSPIRQGFRCQSHCHQHVPEQGEGGHRQLRCRRLPGQPGP